VAVSISGVTRATSTSPEQSMSLTFYERAESGVVGMGVEGNLYVDGLLKDSERLCRINYLVDQTTS
jgi:hypothetical protein